MFCFVVSSSLVSSHLFLKFRFCLERSQNHCFFLSSLFLFSFPRPKWPSSSTPLRAVRTRPPVLSRPRGESRPARRPRWPSRGVARWRGHRHRRLPFLLPPRPPPAACPRWPPRRASPSSRSPLRLLLLPRPPPSRGAWSSTRPKPRFSTASSRCVFSFSGIRFRFLAPPFEHTGKKETSTHRLQTDSPSPPHTSTHHLLHSQIVYDKIVNPGHWTVPMREAALEPARLRSGPGPAETIDTKSLLVADVGRGHGLLHAGRGRRRGPSH